MEAFIEGWSWLAFILIFIVEYLIGISKIKENSMIEIGIKIIKFIFRLEKKEE